MCSVVVVRYMSTAGVTEESGQCAVCSVVVVRYMSTAGVTKESGQCAVLWLSGVCLQLE